MFKLSNKQFSCFILTGAIFMAPVFNSCSKITYTEGFSGSGVFISSPSKGIINLTVQGTGRTRKQREYNAANNAIKILIFQGLSGSSVAELALIRSNTQQEQAANNLLRKMFSDGTYKRFIVHLTATGNMRRTSEAGGVSARAITKTVDYSAGIQYEALRRYLEDNNVVRKFGF